MYIASDWKDYEVIDTGDGGGTSGSGGAEAGQAATPEDVEATADRLYVDELRFDPKHWYRMQHHFPIIDEENYDRFAALVIADLCAGPLHEAAVRLRVGERLLRVAVTPDLRIGVDIDEERVRRNGGDRH